MLGGAHLEDRLTSLLSVLLVAVSAASGACSSKGNPPTPSASPLPSSASSGVAAAPAASSAVASAVAPPKKPDFLEIGAYQGEIFPLRNAFLVCAPRCQSGAGKPAKLDIVIVDRKGTHPGPASPEGWFRQAAFPGYTGFEHPNPMTFEGSYPDDLVASISVPTERGGFQGFAPLHFTPKGWENGGSSRPEDCDKELSLAEGWHGWCARERVRAQIAKHYPELITAPWLVRVLVVLRNGELRLVGDSSVARFADGAWKETPAPWKLTPERAYALQDGRMVVQAEGAAYLVDDDGTARPVVVLHKGEGEAPGATGEVKHALLRNIGDEVWIGYDASDGSIGIAAPTPVDSLKLVQWPVDKAADETYPPKPAKPAPHDDASPPADPSASASPSSPPAPSASVAASASAGPATSDAGAADELPSPSPFTSACKAPFVLFAAKHDSGFYETPDALARHPKLGDAIFVEMKRGDTFYFGGQFSSEEQAKQAVDLAKDAGLHPQLGCFDVKKHIPDLLHPPPSARIYWLNLKTGQRFAP